MTTGASGTVIRAWQEQKHRAPFPRSSRSGILHAIKTVLVVTGLGLLASLLLWDSGTPRNVRMVTDGQPLPRSVMTQARMVGRDAEGHQYRVTALRIAEDQDDDQTVHLDGLEAMFYAGDGGRVSLTAGRGRYDAHLRRVVMTDGVRMTTRSRTSLETSTSEYDLTKGVVHGNDPVLISGTWGELHAGAFRFRPADGVLEFSRRPVLTITAPTVP